MKYNIFYFIHQSVKKSEKTSTFYLKKEASQIKVKFHRHYADKNTTLYLFTSLYSIITAYFTLFQGIINVCVIHRILKKINIPVYHEVATSWYTECVMRVWDLCGGTALCFSCTISNRNGAGLARVLWHYKL